MDSNTGGTMRDAVQGSGDRIFSDRYEDSSSASSDFALRVLERATYGARPEDLDHFLSLGSNDQQRLNAWLDEQLDWQGLDDSGLEQRLAAAGYLTLDKTITELWADHVQGDADRYLPAAETEAARILRAVYSRRQVYEVMTEFWHDHFSVAGWDFSIAPVLVQYDRDVIRPHALGNFREMLEAVARSTAMLIYLDNKDNRAGGYNENWARELMELHTLGSDAYYPGAAHGEIPLGDDDLAIGYSDADVYDVARCFTGWTIRSGHWEMPDTPEYDNGDFIFFVNWHEGGNKYVLGNFIFGPTDQMEAELAMDYLCMHRQTARHLCEKICRRLVDDEPPQSLVESAAQVWHDNWQAGDQVAKVVRHILSSADFVDGTGTKIRRPFELMCAAFRKTAAEIEPQPTGGWDPWGDLLYRFRQTGHGCFRWPSPDGYPDTADRWTSASVMGQTWRLLSRMVELDDDSDRFLLCIHQETVAGLPDPAQRSAEGLVDFWLERLVGRPVASGRRSELIDFMRQNAAADAPLDITSGLPDGDWNSGNLSAHYTPSRLRAAVALIMMLPEFYQR
ncbi:MAG: DUF1800 domain-containing protein [Wenzhouxiangella sp.]|jgi:uncharacterized protein (DUF1800 family)|nr:DUF1800 domain-containing protein [Wenzhouxiangella sp.]